jgi:hypothetical protein
MGDLVWERKVEACEPWKWKTAVLGFGNALTIVSFIFTL